MLAEHGPQMASQLARFIQNGNTKKISAMLISLSKKGRVHKLRRLSERGCHEWQAAAWQPPRDIEPVERTAEEDYTDFGDEEQKEWSRKIIEAKNEKNRQREARARV